MSSPAVRPGRASNSSREGASPARRQTRRSRLGSSPRARRAQHRSASRSGLWTRQKLPPHRSSQAAAVQISSRVQPVSDRAAGGPQSPAACRTRRDSREGCTPPSQSHRRAAGRGSFVGLPGGRSGGLPGRSGPAACSAKRTASGSSSTPVTDSAAGAGTAEGPAVRCRCPGRTPEAPASAGESCPAERSRYWAGTGRHRRRRRVRRGRGVPSAASRSPHWMMSIFIL